MMKLRSSPASPFVRKVSIAAALLGLADRIEVVAADTNDPADTLRVQNPLGKIPTLVLEDGRALYDSRVIVEYLDLLAGGGKLIPAGPERLRADAPGARRRRHRRGDPAGLRAALARAGARSANWIDHQTGKIARGLAALEAAPPPRPRATSRAIALACALGYLDLRFEGAWRADHPRLVAWLAASPPPCRPSRRPGSGLSWRQKKPGGIARRVP